MLRTRDETQSARTSSSSLELDRKLYREPTILQFVQKEFLLPLVPWRVLGLIRKCMYVSNGKGLDVALRVAPLKLSRR